MRKNLNTMSKFLLFVIWLAGAIVAAVIVIRAALKDGEIFLDDLLLGILTCLFSFFGIAFLGLLNVCQWIACKFGNPIVWQRNQDE